MTLQRLLVCVSILGLFACVRSDAAPKARRPVPSSEAVAAVVLHVGGSTTVRPAAGAAFVAAVDHELVRSDRLEPHEGAFAIVGLQNGHVVRIDDAGALAVSDILLLQAPTTTRPVQEQLASLLDTGERRPGLEQGVAERAAAWRQMRRAAETSGTRPAVSSNDEAKNEEAAADERPASKERARRQSPVPAARAPAPAKDAPAPGGGAPTGGAPAAPAEVPSQTKAAAPAPPPPAGEPGVTVKVGPTVATATPLSPTPALGGGLQGCLEQTARDVGLAPGAVTLWLQVKAGVVVRVRLAGALPVSACAAALQGRAVSAADGWLVVDHAP